MILLTGATGFLGSHVLYELLKQKKPVRATYRNADNLKAVQKTISLYSASAAELLESVEWVKGDLTDCFFCEDIFHHIDEVYHCAATVSFDRSDAKKIIENNVITTENIVNTALENNVQGLCYVSSIATLGRNTEDNQIIDENIFWQESKNNSNYAKSKYLAELVVWRAMAEGLPAVIVNPSVIIGPGNWNTGSPALFKYVNDGSIFYTDGVNGYVYVCDVARVMLLLMEQKCWNQQFIVSAENLSYKDLFGQIARLINKTQPQYRVGRIISELAWRFFAVKAFFTRSKPLITRETARTAQQKYFYTSEKLLSTIPFKFTPMETAIAIVGKQFLEDQQL